MNKINLLMSGFATLQPDLQ